MKKNSKAVCALALVVFLLAFLLPSSTAGAVGGFLARDRYPVAPSNGGRGGDSPVYPEPEEPVSPQPGDGQEDNETPQNSYSPPNRTIGRRGGGFYVPPASPSNPSTPPSGDPPVNPSEPSQPPAIPGAPSWLTADEAKAYMLLNEFRIENNLDPLQADYELTRVARLKAQDMVDHDYFSHVSPTYGSISQMLRNEGISFSRAAENLSKAGNVNQAHIQLVYSTKGHRQIMLNPNYNNVGIGVKPLKKTPGIVMVQLFTD